MQKYIHDIATAFEAIIANRFRSFLTTLGIMFGVAAVISMLAIGKGAQQELLEQIKLVGVNNIIITPIIKKDNAKDEDEESTNNEQKYAFGKSSKGLNLEDAKAIENHIPTVKKVCPEITIESYVIKDGKRKSASLYGITKDYFELFSLELLEGRIFNDYQNEHGKPVCIIGEKIKSRFFNNENPINKYIKCGNVWLKVIGVLKTMNYTQKPSEKFKISNSNDNIYLPIKTILLRYTNRALITSDMIQYRERYERLHDKINYNQLDKIVVQVKKTEDIAATTEILNKMLLRRHSNSKDFEIIVPELLLKQQQKTKDIFNIVLGAIAGISLLVGGIGIMNIMLASVLERIREIGTRQALGATRMDIIVQFLAESTLISVTGGIIGIILGIVIAKTISKLADILTIVSPGSVIIAFGISVTVGVIFGYIPAKRASERNPVESLRYE